MLRKVSEEIIGKINYFMIYQAFDCSFLQKKKSFITLTGSISDL